MRQIPTFQTFIEVQLVNRSPKLTENVECNGALSQRSSSESGHHAQHGHHAGEWLFN